MTVPHESHQPNVLQRIDLKTALQYGTAQGYPPLYAFIREFALTRLNPNIPYKNGAEIILTCGNTDGFNKVIDCFVNPWSPIKPVAEREALVVEEFAYSLAIATARPRGMNVVPIAIDAEGMLAYGHPQALYNVLSNWDAAKEGSKRPHMMYTVTMGQNPTSGLLSVKRRKEIYEVCQKFDILIVEDDPYFYIQFPHAANEFMQKNRDGKLLSTNHFAESGLNHQTSLAVPVRGKTISNSGSSCSTTRMRRGKSSGSEFMDSLVPSYLSLDVDGRVIRLDTFSKTVAPGCRLGWITAQPEFVERILRITESSTQQPSGFVQSLVAEMLIGPDHADMLKSSNKSKEKTAVGWKVDGWIRWLAGLRGNYERRMRIMCDVFEKGKFVTTSHKPTFNDGRGFEEGMDPAKSCRSSENMRRITKVRGQRVQPVIACSYARAQERVDPYAVSQDQVRALLKRDQAKPSTSPSEDELSFEMLHKVQVYDFNPPMAGMFLWLRLGLESHPLFHSRFTPDRLSFAFWILQTHKPFLTLVAPGSMFASSEKIRKERGWAYYRVCFAAVDDEEIKAISERFVQGCHAFFEITDEEEIQKLLDEGENHGLEAAMESMSLEEQTKLFMSPAMC